MRRGDREIALAFTHMEDSDIDYALTRLPQAKADRIREEIAYQKRLRITNEQYERIVVTLMDALSRLDHKMSVVFITHRAELLQLADTIIGLEDGKITSRDDGFRRSDAPLPRP